MTHRFNGARRWMGALAGTLLTIVLGCTTTKGAEQPVAPPAGQVTTPAAQPGQAPGQAAVPATSAVSDPAYVIGPGDSIQIFVWRSPELSVTVPVRPDGKISSPLVEDMVAVGKTPSQLARDIETRLAEYVRTPQVNVIVVAPANAFNQ